MAEQHQLQTVYQKFTAQYKFGSRLLQDVKSTCGSFPTQSSRFAYGNYTGAGMQYPMERTYIATLDLPSAFSSPIFFHAPADEGIACFM